MGNLSDLRVIYIRYKPQFFALVPHKIQIHSVSTTIFSSNNLMVKSFKTVLDTGNGKLDNKAYLSDLKGFTRFEINHF